MDYYTLLNNQTNINRPLLTATQADEEIARLHGIIKALQGTVFELQEAFAKLARGKS
jgi:hypothetical protein